MSRKQQQNLDPLWAYPAAVACWDLVQRYPDADRWEQGDGLASILVHVAHHGPVGLTHALKDLDDLPMPSGFTTWSEEARRLFTACGVREHFGEIRDRTLFRASPYHVHLALSPAHPMFDPRNLEELDDAFVTSINEVGEAIQVCLVTLHEDDDGVLRLYSRDGGRRTRGVRAANLRRLSAWYRKVGELSERKAQQLGPPALIRSVDCKAYVGGPRERLVHTIANDARRENSLAKEAMDVWDLVRDYTPAQIARAKAVSEKHVADLMALQRLDANLWTEFCQGRLPPAVGYRLGREASKERQRDAWRATEGYKSGKARLDAISQFLTDGTLPSAERRPAIPTRAVARAAERLRGAAPDVVVDVLAAVAGDREALSRLPEPVRVALTSHETSKAWAKAGLAATAEAWQQAGVTDAKAAKAMHEAGLAPADLGRQPPEKMRRHAWEYGVHHLELGEEELQRVLDEHCTIRTLLDNFLLDPPTAAALLQDDEDEDEDEAPQAQEASAA